MHKSAQLFDRLPSQRRAELGTSEVSVRAGQSLGFCVAYPTIRERLQTLAMSLVNQYHLCSLIRFAKLTRGIATGTPSPKTDMPTRRVPMCVLCFRFSRCGTLCMWSLICLQPDFTLPASNLSFAFASYETPPPQMKYPATLDFLLIHSRSRISQTLTSSFPPHPAARTALQLVHSDCLSLLRLDPKPST